MTVGITLGKMLGKKEDVHLVCPNHIADDQIVGPVIAVLARLPRRPAGLDENLFMRVEQSGDLPRHRFATLWRPLDRTRLGHIVRRRKRNTAECDDAFGQLVHQLDLLVVVLIKEEMQLVKGGAGDLPVMLFIQVAQRHGICQQRVERIGAGAAHIFAEPDWHGIDRPELLKHFVLPALPVSALGDSPQSHCTLSCQAGPLYHGKVCRPGAGCIDRRQLIAEI